MSTPLDLYETLLAAYGPQHWWPARGDFEMMVGAILVQNTAWTGASRAVAQLEEAACLDPAILRALPDERLWELIRPAGYFRVKGERLRALCRFLGGYGDDLDRLFALDTPALRAALLGVRGVGKETADSILCYAARCPVFVVDAYTRRIFHRLGWTPAQASYDHLQALVHAAVPLDTALLNEFHALIVRHAKEHCRSRAVCGGCLVSHCPSQGSGSRDQLPVIR